MHKNCYAYHGTLGGEELESLTSLFSPTGRRLPPGPPLAQAQARQLGDCCWNFFELVWLLGLRRVYRIAVL